MAPRSATTRTPVPSRFGETGSWERSRTTGCSRPTSRRGGRPVVVAVARAGRASRSPSSAPAAGSSGSRPRPGWCTISWRRSPPTPPSDRGTPQGSPPPARSRRRGSLRTCSGTIMHPHRDGDGARRVVPADVAHARARGRHGGAHGSSRRRSSWRQHSPTPRCGPRGGGSDRSAPTSDRFVGQVRDGLFVATGHGSEGVILGAGTAELLGAQIAGEAPPFDPAPFEPLRFHRGLGSADARTDGSPG